MNCSVSLLIHTLPETSQTTGLDYSMKPSASFSARGLLFLLVTLREMFRLSEIDGLEGFVKDSLKPYGTVNGSLTMCCWKVGTRSGAEAPGTKTAS